MLKLITGCENIKSIMNLYSSAPNSLHPFAAQYKTMRCSCCNKFKPILSDCKKCGKTFYCSDLCKNIHAAVHALTCQSAKLPISPQITKTQVKCLVGLQNMGNTCYINSCLQCMLHTQELTQYFQCEAYKKEINQDNQMGTSGKLAEAYAGFVKAMRAGGKLTFRPTELKKVIGKVNNQFQSFEQEDANSFFTTLIDTMHEDLNRVKKKPNKSPPDVYGKPVEDGARISWLHYFSRNQSIITDVMTGIFKSTLYCYQCRRQSLTFDTFTEVSLPIPSSIEHTQLTFYVLFSNFRKPVIKSSIEYRSMRQDEFVKEAKQKIGESSRNFKMYFLSENKQIVNCETVEPEILEQEIKEQRAFLVEVSQIEEPISNKNAMTCFFSRTTLKGEFSNIWIKRPFFIDLKNQTGRSFTITILKYLYNTVYKQPQQLTIFGIEGVQYKHYQTKMLEKQESQDKVFKLILLKTMKRQGKRIIYDMTNFVQISGGQLIYSRIKDLVEINQDENEQSIMQKFELAILLQKQSYNHFDFDRLHDGIKEKQKTSIYLSKMEEQKQGKETSLQKCLDAFGSEENLDGDNLWYCAWCECHVKANKKLTIYRTPDILVFVINRFKLRQDGKREKNTTPVTIPLELDLEKYVVDTKPMSCFVESAKKKCIYEQPAYPFEPNLHPIQKFQLYAFIQHRGELNTGHYMAYAKKDGRWFLFNDKNVDEVSAKDMDWRNAYVVFYRRHKA